MEFKDKFVAFVDILGFKQMVEAAERGEGRSLAQIRELMADLGDAKRKAFAEAHGPQVCPAAARISRNLDYQATQVSDCVVISTEASPAGLINLVSHCWGSAITLLTKGVLVRGYITRGRLYHEGQEIIGSGYQNAYARESQVTAFRRAADEKGTPFVEVDPEVCAYVEREGCGCVREMFGRYVRRDGDLTALFPFKRLGHSFTLGGYGAAPFDPAKEKAGNDNVRRRLHTLKSRILEHVDSADARAMSKVDHYLAAVDEQLAQCDRTDEMIDKLAGPIGRPAMRPAGF